MVAHQNQNAQERANLDESLDQEEAQHLEWETGFYEKTRKIDKGVKGAESYLYDRLDQTDLVLYPDELREKEGKRKAKRGKDGEILFEPYYLHLPLVVDTEYQTLPNKDKYPDFYSYILDKLQIIDRGSLPLTVQFSTIRETKHGVSTVVHPLFKKAFPNASPDLPCPKNPLQHYINKICPGSFIEEFPEGSDMKRLYAVRKVRVLRIDLFMHFAVADILKMWNKGPILDQLNKFIVQEEPVMTQKRHTKIERNFKVKQPNGRVQQIFNRWAPMPAIVRIDGVPFALEMSLNDTSAMAGLAGRSLKGFHSIAGVPLQAKDNYTQADKELMLFSFVASCDRKGIEAGAYNRASRACPGVLDAALMKSDAYGTGNLFRDYAEGDVSDLYSAVEGFANQMERLFHSLGLNESYLHLPRRTLGSTVHDLLTASIYSIFDKSIERDDENFLTMIFPGGVPVDYFVSTSHARKILKKSGFEPAQARGLAEQSLWTASNARVIGGRAISTAPTLVSKKNHSICDMDLAGAYPRSMDNQLIPIGIPVFGQKFSRPSKRNKYESLRTFLKKYEHEFVPGCWQAVISVEDANGKPLELPSDQDFFPSWQQPAVFEEEIEEAGIWLERPDSVTVYTRQITNAVLTHDSLQWLKHCASRKLRKFILDNARVKASMLYPKSMRIKGSPAEFIVSSIKAKSDGRFNTCDIDIKDGNASVTVTEREYHGWYGITIAEVLTDALTAERNIWKRFTKFYNVLDKKGVKTIDDVGNLDLEEQEEFHYLATEHGRNWPFAGGHEGGAEGLIEASKRGGKHPRDELAKTCSNTVYGDMVSRFFLMSNPCVGNNITARVRSIIWYFEKACKAWNAITDGGLFDLNDVATVKNEHHALTEKNTVFVHSTNKKAQSDSGLTSRPLGFSDPDPVKSWGWNEDRVVLERESGTYELDVIAANVLVNELTRDHVQNCFSHEIDVVNPNFTEGKKGGIFDFEAKGIVKDAAVHGTANYCLRGGHHGSYRGDVNWTIKVRSYKSESHETVLKPFFDQLIDNPEAVDRSKYWTPFIQGGILKMGKYANSYQSSYADTILEPGDTEYQVKIFREFTPSAFRFQTKDQRDKFIKLHEIYRDIGNFKKGTQRWSRGQSFESFYTNEDGILNYKQMMAEVENAIREGRINIHPELEVDWHPMAKQALDTKKELWRDVVKQDRRYERASDTFQADFEMLHEDDFFLPEGY